MTVLAHHPAPAIPRPRLLRAVPTEPPYDDEVLADEHGSALVPLALVLTRVAEPELDLPELATLDGDQELDPAAMRIVEADLRRLFGERRTPRAELPAPTPRAAAAVRMLLEVLTGDRSSRHVAGWVSPGVLAGLESRTPLQHRTLPRCPTLRSIRVTEPADGVAEVSAVVRCGERHRAVALRLEGLDGRWTVTALHIG